MNHVATCPSVAYREGGNWISSRIPTGDVSLQGNQGRIPAAENGPLPFRAPGGGSWKVRKGGKLVCVKQLMLRGVTIELRSPLESMFREDIPAVRAPWYQGRSKKVVPGLPGKVRLGGAPQEEGRARGGRGLVEGYFPFPPALFCVP